MTNTRYELERRKREIDSYFSLLSQLDKGICDLHITAIDGNNSIYRIDNELYKILKANGFILLYNLIEATVRKSIEAILTHIYSDGIVYKKLSSQIKQLWIAQHLISLRKGIDTVSYDKIKRIMFDMASNIVEDNILRLEAECIRTSGNIDAQMIRAIADQIGFEKSINGHHLVTIKEKRNHLAHGELSFSEVGRDCSIRDLISIKEHTYNYLESVMNNICTYLTNKEYIAI